MKIGGMQPKVNLTAQKKVAPAMGQELPKDEVTLGQSSDSLGIMERPLGDLKSGDINPGAIYGMLAIVGAGGAAIAGAGAAGRALGGPMGIAVAAGGAALVGGFLAGKDGDNLKISGFVKGALVGGGLAAAGGAISGYSLPLALGAGAVGGLGGTLVALRS